MRKSTAIRVIRLGVHRVVVDVAWAVAAVYLASLILREGAAIAVQVGWPSLARGIEYGIGTGGHGAGTSA